MNLPRTLIIGMDGATFDLIDPLVRAGHLPALARLMSEGVRGPLQAWPSMNSAAAWSSMITGYNPGQHGVYDFGNAPPQRGYQWRPTTAADRRKDPFWRLLSTAGQRVGVINVPISYPADRLNGFMLAGMDAPGIHSSGFAHPADVVDELRRQGIEYVIDVSNLGASSQQHPHHTPPVVERMIDVRGRTILHLMQSRPWDALMAVFVAPDRMQHFFWPDEKAAVDSPSWTPIRNVYAQIDSFLSQALARIDTNTTVLLVSDHGFGRSRSTTRGLNRLFAQLGLLRYRPSGSHLTGRLLDKLLVQGRKIVPFAWQQPLARALPGLRIRAVSERMFAGIEWSGTQVFTNPYEGHIYINLKGRQIEGVVAPEDYHSLRERVRDILLSLTDAATGRSVVCEVHRCESIYRGPHLERAADLIVEWDDDVSAEILCCRVDGKAATVERGPSRTGAAARWTGGHRSAGIFIASGPHIKRGAAVAGARLYDVAPTILYLHDQPIPSDMDGTVLTDIFTAEHLNTRPIRRSEPAHPRSDQPEAVLDAQEERQIEDRLRDLGYIE